MGSAFYGRGGAVRIASMVAAIAFPMPQAVAGCLICDREIVLDTPLAACFLDRYGTLQSQDRAVIMVDLSDCPAGAARDRGVVEALSMPKGGQREVSVQFVVSRGQLACLRERLEAEGASLDPAALFALDDCE